VRADAPYRPIYAPYRPIYAPYMPIYDHIRRVCGYTHLPIHLISIFGGVVPTTYPSDTLDMPLYTP